MRFVLNALLLVLLVQAGMAVTAQQHQSMKTSAALTAAPDACITIPTLANCSQFTYPRASAAADINKLCSAMHFMAACSVAKACNASGAGPDADPRGPGAAKVSKNNPEICEPFQHVTTVCKLDDGMSRMSGCNNINTMCVAGSKVPTCEAKGISIIPSSPKVNAQVRSICEEMTMDGCEKCMPSWQAGKTWADCDLLEVYSYLCYQMPEMSQCTEWHAMCKADPSLVFCYPSPDSGGGSGGSGDSGGGGGSPATPGPVMKMYFFQEMPFYLLFKNWTPRNSSELLGAWLAIFGLGLLYEFLQMMYGKHEAAFWARRAAMQAAAAAAASQRAMDEEVGGPLAEGVASEAEYSADANGRSCCSSPPVQAAPPVSKRTCCGGIGSAAAANSNSRSMSHANSASSFRMHGSSSRGGVPVKQQHRGLLAAVSAYMEPELVAMDVIRGVARFVLAGLAYLLMLAAMSFNVAIFFAVITGVAAGSMLFGRWRWNTGVAEGYSHCGCGSS